jgi:hypothetical protein
MNPTRRIAVLLACAVPLALHAAPAHAQSLPGAFAPFESWWLHPTQGTLGIFWDGSQIRIDRDGDGANESLFLRPTGSTGIPDAAIGSLRLTPTRTIVYAFGGACGTGGTLVHFYRVPDTGNRLEPIRTGLCIPRGLLSPPGFYDTGRCAFNGIGLDCDLGVSPRRIAVFRTPADEFEAFNLVWVDLETGATSGPNFDFATGFGFLDVSPSGTQAFLQHDLGLPGETDYRLIDLCPGTFGTVINQGGFPIVNVNEQLSAEVAEVAGGTVNVLVRNAGGTVRDDVDFDDCLDVSGACCFDGGGCYDTGTATQCNSGTFLGAGTACSACPTPPVEVPCCFAEAVPSCELVEEASCSAQGGTPHPETTFCAPTLCPEPAPEVTLDGPTSAAIGDTVAYQLVYENAGGVVARGVTIEIQVPYGAENVTATDGGDVQPNLVTWAIGDLAPGAGGSVGFSFRIGCDGSYVFLQALIGSVPPGGGTTYFPSNQIQFEADPVASAQLGVTVASVPSREPLRPGDSIEHVITLDNPGGQAVPARLGTSTSAAADPFVLGASTSFSEVLEDGGGELQVQAAELDWTGSVPPGQTEIRFTTSVEACVPAGVAETSLNFGIPLAAFDSCNAFLGTSNEPPGFEIAQLAEASIGATNLAPAQRLEAPALQYDVQIARPGASVDVVVSLESAIGEPLDGASMSFLLRGFTVTTPPSGPGVVWNAAQRSVEWTGDVPASGPVQIPFTATLAACRGEIDLDGQTAPGCTNVRAKTVVAAVPEPPPGPWLAALGFRPHPFEPGSFEEHLTRIEPGPPSQIVTQLCLPGEYARGIGAAANGDVWVTWLPTYRVNPRRLEFEAFDLDRLYAAGLSNLEDVAIGAGGNDVFFSGNTYDTTGTGGLVVRYDRAQETLAPYFEDDGYTAITEIEVDAHGALAALAHTGAPNALVRIDPTDPPEATLLYEPSGTVLGDVVVDLDGSYLALEGSFGPATLHDVDAVTGDATALVPLATPFPAVQAWGQIEVDALGDLYVAAAIPGLGRLERATLAPTTIVPFSNFGAGTFEDVAIVGLTPAPEPAGAAMASAALAALGLLRSRGALARRARRARPASAARSRRDTRAA